jgi:acyl CoA:acetate/3-ketoacid CoA transferase beta subunit
LTGKACVDLIITDLCVFEVHPTGLVLKELAPGVTEEEIKSKTEASYTVSPDLKAVAFA